MRVGILGGSFDPPHNGHLYLGERMRAELSLDRILVIPAAHAPHKTACRRVSDADRLAMCELLFSDPFYVVSDMELRRGGTSYTVETLRELKARRPDDEFFLLVGSDMLLYFDKWYCWREILSLCTLCSFARESEPSVQDMRVYARDVLGDGHVRIFDEPPMAISSTQIREILMNGGAVDGLLPPAEAAYIQRKGLYTEQ